MGSNPPGSRQMSVENGRHDRQEPAAADPKMSGTPGAITAAPLVSRGTSVDCGTVLLIVAVERAFLSGEGGRSSARSAHRGRGSILYERSRVRVISTTSPTFKP